MSIDGNHNSSAFESDMRVAQRMSKRGALLICDDMVTHHPEMGRPVLEAAAARGEFEGLSCTPDTIVAIPRTHRFERPATHADAKFVPHAWCHARFAT